MFRRPPAARPRTRAPRDPSRTRGALLQAAARRIHEAGFQATDLDAILAEAGVTKGALYHHFAGKDALGYAIVDEVLADFTREKWLRPLAEADDPIQALIAIVQSSPLDPDAIRCGCPLNNLAQEMSPVNGAFRERIARLLDAWIRGIADALARGRRRGFVRTDVSPDDAATYFVALYEGYVSLAKGAQDARLLASGQAEMVRYLESLRPTASPRGHGRSARQAG
jgi:AcrR family transcriptional regulator